MAFDLNIDCLLRKPPLRSYHQISINIFAYDVYLPGRWYRDRQACKTTDDRGLPVLTLKLLDALLFWSWDRRGKEPNHLSARKPQGGSDTLVDKECRLGHTEGLSICPGLLVFGM